MNLKSKIFTKYFLKQLDRELKNRLDVIKNGSFDKYKVTTEKNTQLAPIINSLDTAILNLKKYKESIDRQVEQKNKEIAEINLQLKVSEEAAVKVFKEIEEVQQMKTEFISLASHQLRTPLVGMKWGLEMLLNGDLGVLEPPQYEYVNDVYKSNERMISLVSGLLNVSRVESNRFMINPQPTDLNTLAQEVIDELKQKSQENNQIITLKSSANLPKINIDPQLVHHVYSNLISNAIKYSPDNQEIVVEIEQQGDMVVSKVVDNGYGIPEEDYGQLFEKFFRARNIIKIETDGTGLGLYLAKAVVEAMHGEIWFESEENKGTTFWFSLPVSGVEPKKGEVSLV
jgi:signal transduction histidine kinase